MTMLRVDSQTGHRAMPPPSKILRFVGVRTGGACRSVASREPQARCLVRRILPARLRRHSLVHGPPGPQSTCPPIHSGAVLTGTPTSTSPWPQPWHGHCTISERAAHFGRAEGCAMPFTVGLDLAPEIGMVPTPALVAFAKLLALPGVEIEQAVAQEISENPALVQEEPRTCGACGLPADPPCPYCAAGAGQPRISESHDGRQLPVEAT